MKKETANKIIAMSSAGYDKIAKDFSQSRNYIWEEMEIAEGFINDKDRVLDIGCGNGRFFKIVKKKNANYVGIDNSEKLLEIARDKYGAEAKFITTDATSLPFQNNSFDIVVSFAILHHIPSKGFQKNLWKNLLES